MTWTEAFTDLGLVIASRLDLTAAGATGRALTTAVAGGHLVRVRRDHYALPTTQPLILEGMRVGGRLSCVSSLHLAGVFAFDARFPHLSLPKQSSRCRSPHNSRAALTKSNRDGAELHWWPLLDPGAGSEYSVGLPDALAQSIRCQDPWHSIASLDNALHLGLLEPAELTEVFNQVPDRYRWMMSKADGRAEAGQESILRLLIQESGFQSELQVQIDGVGRVDQLVEGILILEADSRLAHDGWELHVRDRDRDINAARLGYMSLRPAYQRTMFDGAVVQQAVSNLLAAWNHHRVTIL